VEEQAYHLNILAEGCPFELDQTLNGIGVVDVQVVNFGKHLHDEAVWFDQF
jgi:hypothetical protein